MYPPSYFSIPCPLDFSLHLPRYSPEYLFFYPPKYFSCCLLINTLDYYFDYYIYIDYYFSVCLVTNSLPIIERHFSGRLVHVLFVTVTVYRVLSSSSRSIRIEDEASSIFDSTGSSVGSPVSGPGCRFPYTHVPPSTINTPARRGGRWNERDSDFVRAPRVQRDRERREERRDRRRRRRPRRRRREGPAKEGSR